MNDDVRFERLLDDLLTGAAPSRAPARLRLDIASQTSDARQRPRWLALLKEPPMRLSSRVAVGSPTFRLASIMAITLALILAGVAAVATGASLLPGPVLVVPPTHNGLIAYGSNNDIWVQRADGSDRRQLTATKDAVEQDPIWSPDGTRIALWHTTKGVTDVQVLDSDGNVVRTLTAPAGYGLPLSLDSPVYPYAAWSPDGSSIAVPVVADGAPHLNINGLTIPNMDLANFDVASGVGHALNIGLTVGMNQQWSPDGSLLAFSTVDDATDTDSMHTIAPDGTGLRSISKPNVGVGWDYSQRILPDGSGMLLDDEDTLSLMIVSLDGQGDPVTLRTPAPGEANGWASVAPDGKSVAYLAVTNAKTLRVINADGTGDHLVLENVSNPSPVWSPDGTQLLIKQYGQFVVVSADGSGDPIPLQGARDQGLVSWQAVP